SPLRRWRASRTACCRGEPACPGPVHHREPSGTAAPRVPSRSESPFRPSGCAVGSSCGMTRPKISTIIVAWNSQDALATCIGSLRESADAGSTLLEIIVVDNGSSDASVDRARELGVDVVISNPVNAGYGVAA